MYRPQLNPGEEIVRTSPDVTVKNVSFDAFLTNKRIIFVKKTDDLYDKKELVFPLNLVRKFDPTADQAGTPTIEFSIQKPGGDLGDLILKFTQTADYRYSERDDWIEKLKRIVLPEPKMQPNFAGAAAPGRSFGNTPPAQPGYGRPQYAGGMPPVQERAAQETPVQQGYGMPTVPPSAQRPPVQRPYEETRQQPQGMPPYMQGDERRQTPPLGRPEMPAAQMTRPAPEKPLFCRFCGANIPPGSVFCPSCGQRAAQETPAQQGYGMPNVPPSAQRPPVPPSPPASDPYAQRRPPAPAYNAPPVPPGGISLADDPEFSGKERKTGRPPKQPRPQPPGKAMKNQQKAYREAEKQRLKEEKLAEKERKKAMKRGGRGDYDPYGYKESRIPEGLPKIIGIVVAVVVVLAVAVYAFNSGIIGGSSGTQTPSSSSNTNTPAAESTYTPGSTTVSSSFGTWNIQIIYSGEWGGYYTVNGAKTTIANDDGTTEMYGYKQIPLNNPSGTIEVSVSKKDGGTGLLMVDIINQKGQYAASESTSSETGTVTASAAVS